MKRPAFQLFALREAEADLDESVAPAEARAAAKALDGMFVSGVKLPKGLRSHLAAARAELRKRLGVWDTLVAEDDDPPPPGDPPKAVEAALDTFEGLPLAEATKGEGEFDIRIIKPGWGSSGHYSEATLQKAAADKVFPAGLKMFWDHPTKSEDRERPERSLKDLAGQLKEDARWDPNGPEGPGLYAPISTFPAYRPHVAALAEHIGVSIRGSGAGRMGEVDGKKGRIIEAIVGAKSVDFVTAAGAGGKILKLFEAAGRDPQEEDDPVDITEALAAKTKAEAENATLKEAAAKAESELARMREAVTLGEARTYVAGKLGAIKLPDATRERLTEALAYRAKPGADGKLDTAALDASLTEAVKAEVAYIEKIAGSGAIKGMGSADNGQGDSGGSDNPEAVKEAEAILARAGSAWGLTEAEGKRFTGGRA